MRYLTPFIQNDLNAKMVFLAGPRQCGKTTLALNLLASLHHPDQGRYFNWDADEHRKMILQKKWTAQEKLLIFDEFHKYTRWKNWIKGTYDTQKTLHQFLLTGSARLDIYRKGGDSLFGRYHYWRLHPFSLCELPSDISPQEGFQRLMQFGGFPEPFLKKDLDEARRWRRNRYEQVIKQDLRDLEAVKDISLITLFLDLLRERVGSPVVLSHLAQDLEIAPKTAKHWLELLERLYVVFTVRPYTGKLSRTLVKPPKVYFYDLGDVPDDPGKRFENLVACHLWKQMNFLEDRFGYRCELRYIRDKEKREVDFMTIQDRKIQELIEVKWNEDSIPNSLRYYSERLNPQKTKLLVGNPIQAFDAQDIQVRSGVEELSRFRYR